MSVMTLPEIKEGKHCSCAKCKAEMNVWYLIRKSKQVPSYDRQLIVFTASTEHDSKTTNIIIELKY